MFNAIAYVHWIWTMVRFSLSYCICSWHQILAYMKYIVMRHLQEAASMEQRLAVVQGSQASYKAEKSAEIWLPSVFLQVE